MILENMYHPFDSVVVDAKSGGEVTLNAIWLS
jgi:hypothetical protein